MSAHHFFLDDQVIARIEEQPFALGLSADDARHAKVLRLEVGEIISVVDADNDYFMFKTDILAGLVTYSTDKKLAANLETISAERAREIIEMNKRGEKPLTLNEDDQQRVVKGPVDLLADADLSRFDKSKRKKNRNKRNDNRNQSNGEKQAQQNNKPRQNPQGQQQRKNQHQRNNAPRKKEEGNE